jgi:hypothetical protein
MVRPLGGPLFAVLWVSLASCVFVGRPQIVGEQQLSDSKCENICWDPIGCLTGNLGDREHLNVGHSRIYGSHPLVKVGIEI